MPRNAQSEPRLLRLALLGIASVTLWRLALLPFSTAELYVDEAQYWFWGQELDWGYYSKPPLIAWLLRASTEIGSPSPFWIHAPLPLIHAGTAILILLSGRRLFGDRVGALAGFAYATIPGVALACLLVSTDTPMLFFFALALYAQIRLAERSSIGWALVLGAAVGLGLMSKYAMIYFPLSAALAALVLPRARIGWRDAVIAGVFAVVVVSPNILWYSATISPRSSIRPTMPTGRELTCGSGSCSNSSAGSSPCPGRCCSGPISRRSGSRGSGPNSGSLR